MSRTFLKTALRIRIQRRKNRTMIDIRKLDCGVRMVMEPTDYVRSAAAGIWVRAGSSHEKEEISGISHFIEHMMFKGTEKRTARQIAEDADKIGGISNAFTGKEATCYYMKTLSSNIYDGCEILIDMVTSSLFDEKEMDKERQVILEEIKMVRDTPDDDVMDMISELVASGDPIGNSILGTPESLSRIGREEMVQYYENEYSRDNIVIAVSGNFDPDRLADQFEEGLKGMKESKELPEAADLSYNTDFRVKVKDIEQTHICMACPSISLGDDDYYAMVLLNSIFGGSMSSRLFQNIREEKGLAYSVASMNVLASRKGYFNIYAGVAHENVPKAIDAIKEELDSIRTGGVTGEELAMAKEQVKSSYIFGLENINSRMFNLGKNKLLLDRIYDPDEVIRSFDLVTEENILKVAGIIGDPMRYCAAAVTGQEMDLKEMIEN